MKALVTGGGGFIGSAIARRLLSDGVDVRILDSFITGRRDAVPEGAEVVEGDLRDVEATDRACKARDVVFHEAAIRSVPKSVDDPFLTNDCNVTGTLNLLRAAAEAGVGRLIYASSSSVYGDTSGSINREDLPPNPLSPYAVSKLAGEYYCNVWTRLGRVPTISLRYFNVFGPGQHPESKYSAVFPAFVSALADGRAPEVHWDGKQSRDFSYIDDVVQANIDAAAALETATGHVINIASSNPKSVNDVLESVAEKIGKWVDPKHLPKRPGDVRSTHADVSRAANLLGWRPVSDWDESVQSTVDWFLRFSDTTSS